MCSIFRHRINYSGPDNSNALSKNLSADGNSNNDNVPTIMSLIPDSQNTAHDKNRESKQARYIDAHEMNNVDGESCGSVTSTSALDLSILPNSVSNAKGHVSLEIFQQTKMAVAQFAASALTNVHCFDESRPELVAFFNAQRQHLLQLQFIQHLQSQLKRRGAEPMRENDIDERESKHSDVADAKNKSTESEKLSHRKKLLSHSNGECEIEEELSDYTIIKFSNFNKTTNDEKSDAQQAPSKQAIENFKNDTFTDESISKRFQPLLCDISSSLASSIITNHDPPPAPNEPNCLEVLQRRTEEVLDSASQSLHASQLQDEYEYSCKDGQGRGEIFRHRCRYCGKIFGSFSALQIHLRSHTGERPFQCNVCGSKFTTKGNLKVHYQRHTQIYPPLIFPPGVCSPLPAITEPTQIPNAASGGKNSLHTRLPYNTEQTIQDSSATAVTNTENNENNSISKINDKEEFNSNLHCQAITQPNNLQNQDDPEDLSKPTSDSETRNRNLQPLVSVKTAQLLMETTQKSEKYDRAAIAPSLKRNNSYRISNLIASASSDDQGDNNIMDEFYGTKIYRPSTQLISNGNNFEHLPTDFPQIEKFADKSWEDLIEIDTTSETSKLQQLVDNIENKLTDPNQCIFCQKIMSCRSSLQMHIRTHTGERPFRCKICGRAFATKGNLKAHMSIHKIKPPMRSQFKCPVCHQKFSNGIILQQHIRIHTIDDNLNPAGSSGSASACGSVELIAAIAEHGQRLRPHMEPTALEDQNSNKSISASDNFDFSTTSDYSGQRSDSSQGDFDDCLTMEGTDDSRENAMALKPCDKQTMLDIQSDKYKLDESNEPTIEAIDLSARGNGCQSNGNNVKILPHLLTLPANLWLMAAAQEEMQGHLPFLPFAPLGLIGLQTSTPFCQSCFKFFPSPAALEIHVKTEHQNNLQHTHKSNRDILHDSSRLITNTTIMPITNTDASATETTATISLVTTTPTAIMSTATSTTTANITSLSLSSLNQFTRTSTTSSPSPPPLTLAAAQSESDISLTPLPSTTVASATTASVLNNKNLEAIDPTTCYINRTVSDTNGLPSPLTNNKGIVIYPSVDEVLNNDCLTAATKMKNYKNNQENQFQEHQKQQQNESKEQLQAQQIADNQVEIKEEPIYDEIYDVSSEAAHEVMTHDFSSKFHENYDDDLCSKSKRYEQGEIVESTTTATAADCNGGLTTNQLSPNFMRVYPCHQADQLPDAAEHSLMKMQMLTAIPHPMSNSFISMEGQHFPATPLNFQQALLSVGPPVSSMDLPLNNKHYCHVCRRNFSSSSALQIHMRTHTGDKPFQCNVCQKAFTTKGNLKVHMGTHMWSNSTSRRGRRMSLELPLHRSSIAIACENDFMQRRPDVYFPYLPPFFNSLPTKPNDLSSNTFSTLLPRQHLGISYDKASKYPPNLSTISFPPFLTSPCELNASYNPSHGERQLNYTTPPIAETQTSPAATRTSPATTTTSPPTTITISATMTNHGNEIKTALQNVNLDSTGCKDLFTQGIYIKSENCTNDDSHIENTVGNDLNNNN